MKQDLRSAQKKEQNSSSSDSTVLGKRKSRGETITGTTTVTKQDPISTGIPNEEEESVFDPSKQIEG